MPRNSSGTMTALSTFAPSGQTSNSTLVNANQTDINTELTDSLSRSGKGGMLAALAMGNNKITGVANGTLATDVPSLAQTQSDIARQATTVSGTADAITLAFSPTLGAFAAGTKIRWTSAGANTTTTPTITADGFGPYTVKNQANGTLGIGDLGASGQINEAVFNGTALQLIGANTANFAKTNASNTFTQPQTFSITTATTANVQSNGLMVAGNSSGTVATGYGQRAWNVQLQNAAGTLKDLASGMDVQWSNATAGSEASYGSVYSFVSGATGVRWGWGAGIYTSGATGGDKGADTINATALYEAGTAISTKYAPKPQSVAGVGQFVAIGSNAANTSVVLPAGGTWLWFAIYVPTSGTAVPTGSPAAGISAGGTTVLGANANAAGMGFAWRMT